MENSVKIQVTNELGLSSSTYLENPSSKDLVNEFVGIAEIQGYSDMQIYVALMEASERVARKILKKAK